MASVSKHIRRLRTAKHMTQEELAERLFVTRQAVSAWETGKALPDVETLERIAEALGVEVAEIIYGSAPQSPNPRQLKRRWALTGAGFTVILAVLIIITFKNGVYGTWRHGLAFQFTDSNYQISYEDIPNSFSVELDLKDLESNAGKVLYADESGCRVLVDSVDENRQGEYRVWFRACGVYGRAGGQLVSGCQSMRVDKVTWTMSTTAAMTAAVNGSRYPCSEAGASGLI
ncbi:helix-turn-helix domain-containing protein [uncultured Dysosmobacter sp.]|uniref:helix-turn-helix domain-containing protein n=1 Tax=uncultured Dysosmobacter sp. TaxID=2591384 RepID=UPI00260DD29F|nr:helix-turn-helix domain-containing protein [uncultured Dysosmobacter sp.]